MKKFIQAAIATTAIAGIGLVTMSDDAEARRSHRRGGGGIVLGTVIGLGIAGAIAHRHYGHRQGYGPYSYYDGGYGGCYLGEVQCRWSYQRGRQVCWRPRICE